MDGKKTIEIETVEILRKQEEELCIDLEENAILSAEFRQAEAATKAGES